MCTTSSGYIFRHYLHFAVKESETVRTLQTPGFVMNRIDYLRIYKIMGRQPRENNLVQERNYKVFEEIARLILNASKK